MRPIDEESQRTLAVIDQTLAGEAVAPQDADLAELTLILAGQRPQPRAAFAASLDDRVSQRFAAAPARPSGQRARRARRSWLYAPGAAFAAAATPAAAVGVASGRPPARPTAPGGRSRSDPRTVPGAGHGSGGLRLEFRGGLRLGFRDGLGLEFRGG